MHNMTIAARIQCSFTLELTSAPLIMGAWCSRRACNVLDEDGHSLLLATHSEDDASCMLAAEAHSEDDDTPMLAADEDSPMWAADDEAADSDDSDGLGAESYDTDWLEEREEEQRQMEMWREWSGPVSGTFLTSEHLLAHYDGNHECTEQHAARCRRLGFPYLSVDSSTQQDVFLVSAREYSPHRLMEFSPSSDC